MYYLELEIKEALREGDSQAEAINSRQTKADNKWGDKWDRF